MRVMILRMCVRVSVCVCDVCAREMCVSEDWEDRREEEKEGVDTALKNKNPTRQCGEILIHLHFQGEGTRMLQQSCLWSRILHGLIGNCNVENNHFFTKGSLKV